MKILRTLYGLSPEGAVQTFRKRLGLPGPRIDPPGRDFLLSAEYARMMMQFVPCDGQYGLHEAQTNTRSYVYRHKTCIRKLGAFRWRSMQEHLDEILPLVSDPDKYVVDLGGAGCPLGFQSVVVDFLKKDAAGRPVRYRTLGDLTRRADVIFASHVLEHVENLEEVLAGIRDALVPGGVLIVLVPAFSCEGWRAGVHGNARFGGHVWTFGLSGTAVPPGLRNYRNVDEELRRFLIVEKAVYSGDDNIYCLCRKPIA